MQRSWQEPETHCPTSLLTGPLAFDVYLRVWHGCLEIEGLLGIKTLTRTGKVGEGLSKPPEASGKGSFWRPMFWINWDVDGDRPCIFHFSSGS